MNVRSPFFKKKKLQTGLSIVELAVASAIILALSTVAVSGWQLFFRVSKTNSNLTQASLLTEEAVEALNYMRDQNWTFNIANLSLNTPYYLYWSGATYAISTASTTVNKSYLVRLTLSAVERDVTSNIVPLGSGGLIDTRTKNIAVSVVNATSSEEYLKSYILLHDIFNN